MRVMFGLSVLFLSFFSSAKSVAGEQPSNDKDPISIGVSLPLTGSAATFGEDIRNTLLFANEVLAAGRYSFVFEDDQCNGKEAVAVARKFVGVDKLSYVFGTCSGAVLSAASIYQRAKVVLMLPFASAPAISEVGDYVFRTWPSDVYSAELLAQYVAAQHKTIAVLSEETEYAEELARAFLAASSKHQLEVRLEGYLSNESDFKPLLTKLRANKGIEAVFINAQTEMTFYLLLRQLKALGLSSAIYGAYFPGSDSFLKLAGENAEGIVFVDAPSVRDVLDEEGLGFFQQYVERYGTPNSADFLFATTFEGFRAMHQAISSGESVKGHLSDKVFSGIFGQFSFDKNGDIQGVPMVLKRIDEGRVITISK